MLFATDTLDNFKVVTGFDADAFLSSFVVFINTQYSKVVSYYKGEVKVPDGDAFSQLYNLRKTSRDALTSINLNKRRFTNIADWNLLEQLEEVYTKLETINNISVYLRSSIKEGQIVDGMQKDYTLKQFETLERVSTTESKDSSPQNDWATIALHNDLEEEDYTSTGGNLLKITFENNPNFTFINSVLDNIEGEKMYGLDIDRVITFENNDLKVLSYKDTVRQAIAILANLRKGDNPQFPNDGIQSSLIIGNSLSAVTYPALFRQLYSVFAQDDTLSSFAIKDIKQVQDAIYLEFEVNTKYGETIIDKLKI